MRKLILFLIIPVQLLFGQNQPVDSAFNTYYRLSMDKLRQLYQSRGLSDEGCISEDLSQFGMYQDYPSTIQFALQKTYGPLSSKIGVLFYSVSNDSLRIWLLRDTILTRRYLPITATQLLEMEANIRSALRVDVLSAGRAPVKRGAQIGETTRKKTLNPDSVINSVSRILLPPEIARQLSGLNHLMIAPEFNIGQFPFYLLRPFGNESMLIDSISISLNPHICNLLTLDQEEAEMESMNLRTLASDKTPGMARSLESAAGLIVGNPQFSTNTPYLLPQLKGAAEEAKLIAKLTRNCYLTGTEAKLSTVKKEAAHATLLYFATHGVADPSNPLKGSFLAFAPDSSDETGFWTAEDIQSNPLTAKLAILSACQTGVGKIHAGGFIGLGRAFYISRVRNTVMSLWSVDDASTSRLMQYFMEELVKKDIFFPANHLRNAINRYRKTDKNLSHWAPFVVFGFPE